jgi:hypothetical protein
VSARRRRRGPVGLAASIATMVVAVLATGSAPAAEQGVAAPAQVVRELQAALSGATERFEARDVNGVLAYVSDRYRTGPFTKAGLREQLIALYSVYDAVRAKIRIDTVQMASESVWVYTTGEISGRLPLVGTWVVFLSWRHELEVARRETAGWRLYGYQQ